MSDTKIWWLFNAEFQTWKLVLIGQWAWPDNVKSKTGGCRTIAAQRSYLAIFLIKIKISNNKSVETLIFAFFLDN